MDPKGMTVRQIQSLDQMAIERIGIPSAVLMENAGRQVAGEILRLLRHRSQSRVCIFCGLGNNAGDGFVVARHLLEAGIKTNIFLIGSAQRLKEDALLNYHILRKLKYPVKSIKKTASTVLRDMKASDWIVDAIFGVGLNREVKEPFRKVIEALNASGKQIMAVDIPSGLDGTTGKVYGVCIKAHRTVTFSAIKKGFLRNQGPHHVGRVKVVDIGIPRKLLSP